MSDNKLDKRTSNIITIIFFFFGAWYVKQRIRINQEKETGIKQPLDTFDKAGYYIIIGFFVLFLIGLVIGILVWIYELITGNTIP